MGMISRDWQCLNRQCGQPFHSFDPSPACPRCGNVRVHWIPGGGHIGATAPKMDRELRRLSDQFGGMNFNSPSESRLNRAAPRANHPNPQSAIGQKSFGPGFTANIYENRASCEVSQARVNLKASTASIGDMASPFTPSGSVPGPSANAVFHARHVPQGGQR